MKAKGVAYIFKVIKIIFVWSQRQDHLLNEEETWRDQRI